MRAPLARISSHVAGMRTKYRPISSSSSARLRSSGAGPPISPDTIWCWCARFRSSPATYSSCRDAAGIRRIAYVPKDSVITGGHNSVIVSQTGGDYTDPVTAAENAFAGDTWCVAPQWPDQPCVMAIGEGVFILSKTLSIAEGVAVSGNGKGNTMLVADNGVETAVSSLGNVRFSDLTIVNSQAGGGRTTGLNIQRSHTREKTDPDSMMWRSTSLMLRRTWRSSRATGLRSRFGNHRGGAGRHWYL